MNMNILPLTSMVNLGLVFGVVFMGLLTFLVARVRQMPKTKKKNSGGVRTIAIFGILFFFTAIFVGAAFTSYFASASGAESVERENELNEDLEQKLENSLISLAYLSQQTRVDQDEIQRLRMDLEEALIKLREAKTRTRVITVVPDASY